MGILIPSKMITTYHPPVTQFRPVEGRKYTLIRLEPSGEFHLIIGSQYDYDAINLVYRDEVLAEWVPQLGEYCLYGRVHISDGKSDENYAKVRYMIFKKEVHSCLKAIIYGDRAFFSNFPWLKDAPIYIQFESDHPAYNQLLYFGTPRQFLLKNIEKID